MPAQAKLEKKSPDEKSVDLFLDRLIEIMLAQISEEETAALSIPEAR